MYGIGTHQPPSREAERPTRAGHSVRRTVISQRQSNTPERPILSKEQFRAIEQLFPARVIPHSATEAELREYMGIQKVIAELRRRVG